MSSFCEILQLSNQTDYFINLQKLVIMISYFFHSRFLILGALLSLLLMTLEASSTRFDYSPASYQLSVSGNEELVVICQVTPNRGNSPMTLLRMSMIVNGAGSEDAVKVEDFSLGQSLRTTTHLKVNALGSTVKCWLPVDSSEEDWLAKNVMRVRH